MRTTWTHKVHCVDGSSNQLYAEYTTVSSKLPKKPVDVLFYAPPPETQFKLNYTRYILLLFKPQLHGPHKPHTRGRYRDGEGKPHSDGRAPHTLYPG